MSEETQRRSVGMVLSISIAIAVAVSATSFGISRAIVASDREAGAAVADSMEASRSTAHASDGRRKQIEELLARVEQQLVSKPLDSMLLRSAGNLAYDIGRFDAAARYYRTFLDNIDGNATEVRIDLGYAVFESGKPDDGMAIIESVIRRHPSNQVALYNLGIMHLRSNNVEAGRTWLEKCVRVDATTDAGKRAAEIITSLSSAS